MTYRRDIDGLRAIAVLAVVLFHFRLAGLSGGYVGVDVFFVISGYLIGGLIIDESKAGTFTYTNFYSRRIKRLFAAFFVAAMATLPLAWWLLLPVDFRALGKSIVAATVFLPNVLFYREAGYFDPGAVTKPLLHTWSLAVEEQFYIVFPLVVRLLVMRGGRGVAAALGVLCLVSLGYAEHLVRTDTAAAFYWLPSRAWEMMLGALVATPQLRALDLPTPARRLLSALALAALVVPLVAYTEGTPFPGFAALPPCLATAWFLWSGRARQDAFARHVLSARWPVAIGRISYSLYLWHWPIAVYLEYYAGGHASLAARLVGLVFAFVLATLSWRFVEQPFRHTRRPPRAVFGAMTAASVVLAATGLAAWRTDGWPGRLSPETAAIADAATDFFRHNERCFAPDNPDWPGIAHCRVGVESATPSFVVWGDSHGRAIRDGIDEAAREHGTGGILVHAGGCPPLFGVQKTERASGPRSDAECSAQNEAMRSALAKPGSIRKVMLVGRWAYYVEGHGIGLDGSNPISVRPAAGAAPAAPADQATVVAQALKQTVGALRSRGYEVYLLEQMPEIPDYSSRLLFSAVRSGRESLSDAVAAIGTVGRAQVEQRQARANEALRAAAAGGAAEILPTHDAVSCSAAACSAWGDGRARYFDNNHVTGSTSRRVRAVFGPAVAR